jgi:ATP-dependent Clp protease ATP-binding subunit ClpC
MIERFTEKARRVTFFARYEASMLGSAKVEPEHLLLGIFREDKALAIRFLSSHAVLESIRDQIEAQNTVGAKVSTSLELPMSGNSNRLFAYAVEEAGGYEVSTAHLLLGILRLENSFAATVLHGYGLSLATVRVELHGSTPSGSASRVHAKPTACRDCKHLVVDETMEPIARMNLFCGASPWEPEFDCFTGELQSDPSTSPAERYQLCATINFGDCRLFEQRKE